MREHLTTGKITAVIVDDEIQSLEVIEEQIKMYCENVEILDTFDDPILALEKIGELKPDVAFLDINMPKMNGLDLAKKIIPLGIQVIFITAYGGYAIKAIKLRALDYIVKPLQDPEELKAAVKKIESRPKDTDQSLILAQLMKDIRDKTLSSEIKITLSDSTRLYRYKVKDIIRLEAQKNYCIFIHIKDKPRLISKNIGFYKKDLHQYGIVQANRSELVNIDHIDEIIKTGRFLVMSDGHKVTVTDKFKKNFPFFDKD